MVVASQVVLGLQTVVSRQSDLTEAPAIVTVGIIQGGVRGNIIPDSVVLVGTVRTLDPAMRDDVHRRIRATAEGIAASAGARAVVRVGGDGTGVTYNDPELTRWARPTLERAAGGAGLHETKPQTTAEDFSVYQERIPGVFFFLGGVPEGVDPATAPQNHSPLFFVDEGALPVGVRALSHLAADYLFDHAGGRAGS